MLFHAGERAIPIRDELRQRGVLVRDRSYEIPGCVRVTIGTRDQIQRFLSRTGADLVSASQMLVFDMDGVLVEVTESYRETIVQTVRAFHRARPSRANRSRITRTRAAGTTTGRCRRRSAADLGVEVRVRRRSSSISTTCSSDQGHDSSRALASARRVARTAWREVRAGDLHRPHYARKPRSR